MVGELGQGDELHPLDHLLNLEEIILVGVARVLVQVMEGGLMVKTPVVEEMENYLRL
jgi:hypothetical protein